MDIITKICAILLLVASAYTTFSSPSKIGKEGSFTSGDYIGWLVFVAPIVIVCGRCLGWW